MSLDPPAYLASLQNNIRQRPIAWDGAVRAGTLTEEQLTKIRAVDKVKKDVRRQTVEADLDGYRVLFVGEPGKPGVVESASKRSDVVQYILVLLSDLLDCMCLLVAGLCRIIWQARRGCLACQPFLPGRHWQQRRFCCSVPHCRCR